MAEYPPIAIWCTSTGRESVAKCLGSFVGQCTYPNYELLITEKVPDNEYDTMGFFEGLKAQHHNVRIFDTQGMNLAQTLHLLLNNSPDYYLNIEDDCLYLADPGPMIADAMRLMEANKVIGMVRMSCHVPIYIDLLMPRFSVSSTDLGPVVLPFGVEYAQHVTSAKRLRRIPGLWPHDVPNRQLSAVGMAEPFRRAGLMGAGMLRYWGCSVHVGKEGADGVVTMSATLEGAERAAIIRNGMFGRRPRWTLYSTSMNAEQARQFAYPLFLLGLKPLVTNTVPVWAQSSLGAPEAMRVC